MKVGSREAGPKVHTILARRMGGAGSISFFEGTRLSDAYK
jgi:hypothetical protein